jgi:aspartyl aminopeptidase
MFTLILIASIGLGIAILLFLLKLIELWVGMPQWYKSLRGKVDYGLESSLHMTHSTYRSFISEIREALGRIPHLIVHLAIVVRDRLKVRFAKYIDEVRGRKPIVEKKSNSEFLHAVKDYKRESSKVE